MPDADSIDQLTEGERECLRRVLDHKPSKQIALELGIGPDAVDKRIKQAMRKLGVSSRVVAAQLLADVEGGGRYQRRVYQSEPLENRAESAPWMMQRPDTERDTVELREERAAFDIQMLDTIPPASGGHHDQSLWRRIFVVMAAVIGIAILAALVVGGLLSAILAGQQALHHALT